MEFFELRRTLETSLGPEGYRSEVRLEVFQSLNTPRRFRARAFEYESFRLRPTAPQDAEGEPLDVSDDEVAVERGFSWLDQCWREPFEADSLEEAVRFVLADFERASRGEFRRRPGEAGPAEPAAAADRGRI